MFQKVKRKVQGVSQSQIPNTKRKRKETQTNMRKTNKRTTTSSLFTKQGNRNAKGLKNTKTKHKARLNINHFTELTTKLHRLRETPMLFSVVFRLFFFFFFFFFCTSVMQLIWTCNCLFLTPFSFGASKKLCFVSEAFSALIRPGLSSHSLDHYHTQTMVAALLIFCAGSSRSFILFDEVQFLFGFVSFKNING